MQERLLADASQGTQQLALTMDDVMEKHFCSAYISFLNVYARITKRKFCFCSTITSHKSITAFFSLQTENNMFEQELNSFQKNHAGRIINQHDISKLFAPAYLKVATAQNAVSGFKYAGLWPDDPNIFDDEDYSPALVTRTHTEREREREREREKRMKKIQQRNRNG
ncbi:hypothetical protein PR048_017259 [Dryococelus australis]|uniref:Uncharacterized protein n=1 Tax=Dryococelus australis TaxID=614101 RepID=A0ABQ9H921_9NEOP|nr:hypothetical protein PR048_017259 [Dryococelus australis]